MLKKTWSVIKEAIGIHKNYQQSFPQKNICGRTGNYRYKI